MARPPIKHDAILQTLRSRILGGEFGPGCILPSRESLQSTYQASRATIQQVFDELRVDGFVSTNGRGGTAVVARPPHLHRIAVVFSSARSYWSRFLTVLDSEAHAMARRGERDLVVHLGVDAGPDSAAYRQLLAEVQAQRLAGIIFTALPTQFVNSPLWTTDIAKVVIQIGPGQPGAPHVYPDRYSFVQRAVARLAAAGCRRVAALVVENYPVEGLRREFAAAGMAGDPHLIQAVPLSDPAWAEPLVQLLFKADQREPPDGLIICDDNLVESACAGLIAAHIRVPDAVQVVAHGNFPWPAPSALPVYRLGFDGREVLNACLVQIDRQRAGQPTTPETTIAAHFADAPPSVIASV